MTLTELKTLLAAHPAATVVVALPNGGTLPRHFHVTEVGHVAKQFVDCGGQFRVAESCVLQTWTASGRDDGHRLAAGKLRYILGLADSILPSGDLPVEVEYEEGATSQFPVEEVTLDGAELIVHLGSKHTDCLARARCGSSGEGDCAAEGGDEATCCAGAGPSAGKRCCSPDA